MNTKNDTYLHLLNYLVLKVNTPYREREWDLGEPKEIQVESPV